MNDFARSTHAHVDETQVVAYLMSERRGLGHTMLDVGAHFGTSAAFFHELGWKVYCFEPDAKNREKLSARFGTAENVHIDPRAVSDTPAKSAEFFSSQESTGISGLHAFRSTHELADRVEVTTLSDVINDRNIGHVDFLKIDVEGFDFAVLRGTPWDTIKPDVIECEFEDAKTEPLGHTWRDVAEFLQSKGYTVYVSEWHPIVKYGVRHDWRRVFPLGSELPKENAWGNLLAFRDDPGMTAIQPAFLEIVKTAEQTHNKSDDVSRPNSENFLASAPAPQSTGRNTRRRSRGRRRMKLAVSTMLLIIAPLFAAISAESESARTAWYTASLAIILILMAYYTARGHSRIRRLNRKLDVAERALLEWKERFELSLERKLSSLESQRERDELAMGAQQAALKDQQATLKEQQAALKEQSTSQQAALKDQQATLKDQQATLKEQQAALKEQSTSQEVALKEQRAALQRLTMSTSSQIELTNERLALVDMQLRRWHFTDRPETLVLFGHHKCASRFFRFNLFSRIAEMTGAEVFEYNIQKPPFHYSRMDDLDLENIDFGRVQESQSSVLLYANATERSLSRISAMKDSWRGLRIIRDPRQVLVSNYFHHRGDHNTEYNGWIWDDLVRDKPILRELSEEEGLLYELDNISKHVIEDQVLAPLNDDRILTIKLEDFEHDPQKHFDRIAEFFSMPQIGGLNKAPVGIAKEGGGWRDFFTPEIQKRFKERYGNGLIRLGYETDLDW